MRGIDSIILARYYVGMIKSFKDKEARKIFNREYSRRLPSSIQRVAMRKLWMMDAAMSLSDLRLPPANHLEALKGKRSGQHSIRINSQYRICFKWSEQDAYEVEITDYH